MLSLLKKRSDQSQRPAVPAWHPNFRNFERLPDTKVVRTQFFVNFAAIAIAAVLLIIFVFHEYRISKFQGQVTDWRKQIDANKKGSDDALALAKKYSDEEKKLQELEVFLKQRLTLSEFLLRLGKTLPAGVSLDVVDARDNAVGMRGRVAGTPEEATGRASAYVDLLKKDDFFRAIFDVDLNNLVPDPSQGNFVIDLTLRFKGAAAKK